MLWKTKKLGLTLTSPSSSSSPSSLSPSSLHLCINILKTGHRQDELEGHRGKISAPVVGDCESRRELYWMWCMEVVDEQAWTELRLGYSPEWKRDVRGGEQERHET